MEEKTELEKDQANDPKRDKIVSELLELRRETDSKLSDCDACGEECKD